MSETHSRYGFVWLPLFALCLLAVLASCSRIGKDPFLGQWKSQNVELTITKDGDLYVIDAKNPAGMFNGRFTATLKEGKLVLSQSMFGDITHSSERDVLYFGGEEFHRIETTRD
jgi:hypothetical protein